VAEKQPIIIRKKIIAGGHGHHGGAWKVAYADFVTAMMAFFMVMWLMGADETTKAEIANYFNKPNNPFAENKGAESFLGQITGDHQGDGDGALKGLGGLQPEDLVKAPYRSGSYFERFKQMGELVSDVMQDQAFGIEVEVEIFQFSIPEKLLFEPASSKLSVGGKQILSNVGKMLSGFRGHLQVVDHTKTLEVDGRKMDSLFEASVVRAVAVMKELIEGQWIQEDRVKPLGMGSSDPYAGEKASDAVGSKLNLSEPSKRQTRIATDERVQFIMTPQRIHATGAKY
jgi:chemotaxis protein MotB